MSSISEILARKRREVFAIPADASVYDAIGSLVEHNVGALVVLDDGEVAGIFTERDHLRRVTLAEKPLRLTPVRAVMTERVVAVDPAATIDECMAIMTRERIRHLPVVRERELVGMISIGDLVKYVSDERATEVRYLTEYIKGERV